MRKTTILTTFIRELSYLIDKGESISLSELKKHISNKDVLEWLKDIFPLSKENFFDLSFFPEQSYKNYIHDELYDIASNYNCGPAWKINNNGLCTLISMSTILLEDAVKEYEKIDA